MQRLIVLLCITASVQAGVRVPRALHFDIEPHVNTKWSTNPASVANGMVNIFSKIYQAASPLNVPIVADVPLWLATSYVGGNTKSVCERVMPYLDEAVVMAYRDWASGTRKMGDGTNGDGQKGGIVGSMTATLALGESYGVQVTCGIETFCEATPNWVTFCGRTTTYMESQISSALDQLSEYSAFSGTLAIDNAYSWSILTPSYTLPSSSNNRALWQWQGINILKFVDRMNSLFSFSTSHAVKVIYLDALTIFGNNWSATTKAQFINFLTLCDKYDIDVDLLLGDATWCNAGKESEAMDYVNQSLEFIQLVRSMAGSNTPTPPEAVEVPATSQAAARTSQAAVQTSQAAARTSQAAVKTSQASAVQTTQVRKTSQAVAQTTQAAIQNDGCSQNCAVVIPGSVCDGGFCECPRGWRWAGDSSHCIAPAGVTSAAAKTSAPPATTAAKTSAPPATTAAKTSAPPATTAAKTSAPAKTSANPTTAARTSAGANNIQMAPQTEAASQTCSQDCGKVYPNSICEGGFCICPERWRWSSNRSRCVPPSS